MKFDPQAKRKTGETVGSEAFGEFIFAEVDFEEGVRYAGSDSYSFLSAVTVNSELQFAYPGSLYSNTSYAQPFEVTELKTAEPSLIDKGSVIVKLKDKNILVFSLLIYK